MSHGACGHLAVRLALALATMTLALGGCTTGGSSVAGPATATPGALAARTLSDLAYADASPQETLDLYLPAVPAGTSTPAPLVIWIHGGGWRTGTKNSINQTYDQFSPPPEPTTCTQRYQVQSPVVQQLTGHGYAVAAINYRLDRRPADALADAKVAVRYLRANAARFHLDPNRFAAWGNSAGGWTAVMLGATGDQRTAFDDPSLGHAGSSSAVQAVVDWYGPTAAASMPGHTSAAELPFTYIRPGHPLPPFRIAHGSADCTVPVQQSRRLFQALTAAGDAATLSILPGAYHEDPAFMRTELSPTMAFLDRALSGSAR